MTSFYELMKQKAEEAKTAIKADQEDKAAAHAEASASAGSLIEKGVFGGQTIEIYDGGYIRVSMLMNAKTPFEKLRSIKMTTQVQDKSAGGRAAMGAMTMGLNYLGSKEKRVLLLAIATDKKVHTLKDTGGMGRGADQTGMRLEAAGTAVVDALGAAAASAPIVVQVAAPEAAAPAAADPLEQLKKLGELRDAGILSEEEFAAKKADILGRM